MFDLDTTFTMINAVVAQCSTDREKLATIYNLSQQFLRTALIDQDTYYDVRAKIRSAHQLH